MASIFRLAIEALGVKHGGGATVLKDLLAAALADPRCEEVHVFCSPRGARTFDLPASKKILARECAFAEGSKLYRLWWLERRLPGRLRELGCDVLICLSGCGTGGDACPHLTVVQQSLPFSAEAQKLASKLDRWRIGVLRWGMRRSCRSSCKVIVQTRVMSEVVGSAFAIPAERIVVCAPSVRRLPDSRASSATLSPMRAARPGQRILYVGNSSAYKNIDTLIDACVRLRQRRPDLSLLLTLPAEHPAAKITGVTFLGYLNEDELAEAYTLADVFVLPSVQETVGLPLLEAMSAGIPVIAADRPYAREVCESAALFFDPHDPADLERNLDLVLSDEELRRTMSAEGLRICERRRVADPYGAIIEQAFLAASESRDSGFAALSHAG